MICTIFNPKGGANKTTLTVNLAVALATKGFDVGILDSDKKPDSIRFAKYREINKEKLAKITFKESAGEIDDTIINMNERHDYVFCDTGGYDSVEWRYGLAYGHISICPFAPSDLDTAQGKRCNDRIKEAKVFNPELKSYAVISSASNNVNSKTNREAMEILKKNEEMILLKTVIHQRDAFRNAFKRGKGVHEWTDSKAKAEIDYLCQELFL